MNNNTGSNAESKIDEGRVAPNSREPRLPYPDGWFVVAFSNDVRPGHVLRSHFMGEDIVIYRTASGLLRVCRPYCPHLGAHLGYGGRVDGEDIVCPFHHFAYSPSGACVRNEYGTPPPKAQLTMLESREIDGLALVWHHARNHLPDWDIPGMQWNGYGLPAHSMHVLVDHPQEVMENSIDLGHLPTLHGFVAKPRKPIEFIGTCAELDYDLHPLRHLGGFLTSISLHVTAKLFGLGVIRTEFSRPKWKRPIVIWALPTSINPRQIELRFMIALPISSRNWPRPLREIGTYGIYHLTRAIALPLLLRDVSKDFPVWQNKVYLEHPRLARGDGPIMRFRHWCSQFYSISTDVSAEPAPLA
ncbi:Rieske 2Fe-2S domain-containing protein [Nocardia sp. JMUB6875]|uniref:Rieske 2Fe-2S domain-containing protein n=1 Tax=Nocardia sp. JMUB6875 TaxID=3158170 RepID=UPI0034E8D155